MSLKITGDQIIIQNSDGTTKFNSDNKLVYKKYTTTGSSSLGGSYGIKTYIALGATFDSAHDMALIYVTVTGGAGNVTSQVNGSTLQLNFPMLMDFQHSTTAVQITQWDVLTGLVIGSTLEFAAMSYVGGTSTITEAYTTAASTISFDWKVVILSYR